MILYEITTQAIGFLGMTMMFIMFQQNDRKRILLCQILGTCFFCIHFYLLQKYTGSALNLIAAVRAVIYYNRDKKFFGSVIWLWIFVAISIVSGILTWEGMISVLPTIAMIIGSVSVWVEKPRTIRILSIIPSPMWLSYNIVGHSLPGIITEIFVMTSIAISIIRYDILKKEQKSHSANND
ncbi:MAG: YgjV family protein [Candidatus Saccharimonadaceae bacterium]|nr:YgjV family protein [Candidatus Saccharimonadaceae bacterium]